MDFISKVGSFFSNLYNDACSFVHDVAEGTPPRDKPVDHFKAEKIGEAHFDELLRSSRPVRTGCYIEMHQVREFNPQQRRQQLQNSTLPQTGSPRPAQGH